MLYVFWLRTLAKVCSTLFCIIYSQGDNFHSLLMGGSIDGCCGSNPVLARDWSVCPAWYFSFPASCPSSRTDWKVLCETQVFQ